jgi:ubiquinol-cytochrome c reductase cytochrome b subunit
MKALWSWFNARTGCGDWCGRRPPLRGGARGSTSPGGACCCKVWPCAIAIAFAVQAITGFFLWVYYSPSAQTAWESVYYLQYHVAGGWLLRAMHHSAAHVLLAMLIIYIVQSILTRACRPPRELVFWATVGLGLCALAAVLTGDLLSWDQNGYAATKTRTGFLMFLPWVGGSLLRLAIGGPGPALGSLTLTRFFALHVGLFAGGFLLLLIVRGVLACRASQCTPHAPREESAVTRSVPSTFACLAVLAVVLLLACQHGVALPGAGVPLLSPADTDPANNYAAARPEWFLTGVYEFSHFFERGIIPIFIVPGLLLCLVLAMPFLARHPAGHFFNVVFTLALLAAVAGLTYYSYAKDRADPLHQKAIAAERWQAARVRELIGHEGIPPTGALTLLRNDPLTQGPRLFGQQCASCHNHAAGGDRQADILAEKPTAPNLSGYASRRWLAGLLDPKQINGPRYFGNTKLRGGKMAGFVKETFSDFDANERAKVIAALSAEAKLPSQQQIDAKDAGLIEEGRQFIAGDAGCTDCHKFHDKGTLGVGPLLTGYGSAGWIVGIIGNPAGKLYYGKLNDRMPAYAPSADPAQNTLSAHQITMLTDWLRGNWYEQGRMTKDE